MRWQLIILLELLFFFLPIQLYSVPVIQNVCSVHTVWILYACSYFMHILKNITFCFPGLHFAQLTFSHLLMTAWLIFFGCFFLRTLNPPEVRCRLGVSPLSLKHTNPPTHTHAHRRLQKNINWIPGLFTQCLSAGYGQGSPVYKGVGFMVSLTVSNKHLPICAAGSQQQEPCFRSGR